MVGLRHTYVTILGVILISYGIILNMLGAIASFLHPGSYHHGAMGTPMWVGLAFIIFGAVNAVKGLDRNPKKRGISLVLPLTNFLTMIVSSLCIALTSWSMSAQGIAIIPKHPVTEFSVTSQQNTTNGDDDRVSDLQLSLIPIYSTIISSCIIIIPMAFISLCIDCIGIIIRARPAIAAEVHHGKGFDERDETGKSYPIVEDETAPQYHHGNAIGEVMYGNTPPVQSIQVVKTIERPRFHHHMEPIEDNHRGALQYHAHHNQHDDAHQPGHAYQPGHTHQSGHTHRTGYGQSKSRHTTTHQPEPNERDHRVKKYPIQPNSAPDLRETERAAERRPNPYFYL
eukprot:XP_011680418.1 PREDICTED: uncharacterized protein LOC100889451 isoform X2 [Strongylocentrotus purpuratus]